VCCKPQHHPVIRLLSILSPLSGKTESNVLMLGLCSYSCSPHTLDGLKAYTLPGAQTSSPTPATHISGPQLRTQPIKATGFKHHADLPPATCSARSQILGPPYLPPHSGP
jgi:hypothetical protein